MLKIVSFEIGSLRVTDDDSKDEKFIDEELVI